MLSVPMEVYLDFSLRKKVNNININVNQLKSQMSNMDVFYLSNRFKPTSDGRVVNTKIVTDSTFFIRFTDETNNLNFTMLRYAYFGNVFESDFETMSFTPPDPENYANYYGDKVVEFEEGDWLYFAYVPFGRNVIELNDGKTITTCGTQGKVWIEKGQAFKRYVSIPKVPELFAMGPYKIMKLVIGSMWEKYGPQRYSVSIFSPDMKEVEESAYDLIPMDDVLSYVNNTVATTERGLHLVDWKNPETPIRANASIQTGTPIRNLKNKLILSKSGYVNMNHIGPKIKEEFTIHMNFSAYNTNHRGTILFEAAYGIDDDGNQTHHITIWANKDGFICYNCKFNDEYVNTGEKLPTNIYTTMTFVLANVQINPEKMDEKKYMGFIFINGRQIWPKETYLNPDEVQVLSRGYKAYRTYTDVCMNLEANTTTMAYIDAKSLCIKKLLKESGFVSIETLNQVYQLYLNAPSPTKVDIDKEFVIGDDDKTTIKKLYFGQDSYEDILDQEYYFEGEIYEIVVLNRAYTRREVENINLISSLGYSVVDIYSQEIEKKDE